MNLNEDNNLISSSPFDLFKIINEIFDLGSFEGWEKSHFFLSNKTGRHYGKYISYYFL